MKFSLVLASAFVGAALHFPAAADPANPLDLQIGTVKVKILFGDIVHQDTDALALSHWDDRVNIGGGVGGAISDNGGGRALKEFKNYMEQKMAEGGRPLPYTSVHMTPIGSGGNLKAKFLLNVIELAPASRVAFTTVSQVQNSEDLRPEDKPAYEALIAKYAPQIEEQARREEQARAALDVHPSNEVLEEYLNVLRTSVSSQFEEERRQLTEKYQKPLGFDTVALSVRNTLMEADKHAINSISFATMGYGVMGDLTLVESVSAMLAGIKLYASGAAPKEHEVRVVFFFRDSSQSRGQLLNMLAPALQNGRFLEDASRLVSSAAGTVNWAELQQDFVKNDQPSMRFSEKPSVWITLKEACSSLLQNPR